MTYELQLNPQIAAPTSVNLRSQRISNHSRMPVGTTRPLNFPYRLIAYKWAISPLGYKHCKLTSITGKIFPSGPTRAVSNFTQGTTYIEGALAIAPSRLPDKSAPIISNAHMARRTIGTPDWSRNDNSINSELEDSIRPANL